MRFSADALCQHVTAICTEIGPRLAGSVTERSAAYYVETCLRSYDLDPVRQTFPTIERFSKRLMPQIVLSATTLGVGLLAKGAFRWGAGLLNVGLAWHHRRIFLGHKTLWENTLAESNSQNVIVKIPSKHEARHRVVLIAHIDTGFNRWSFHPSLADKVPSAMGFAGFATLGGGLLTLLGGEREWAKSTRMNLAASLMVESLLVALDEFNSPVIGANDNASGVAVLLNIAERLVAEPLDDTEVWMIFTGSETVGGAGLAAFLAEHSAELHEACCLVVKGVGMGNLCWVTKHNTPSSGISYEPHPDALKWAMKTAKQHPEWGIVGREMTTLDEVAILNHYALKGVALMGYDRVTGQIPHLNQFTDSHTVIDPAILETAAEFVWSMIQSV